MFSIKYKFILAATLTMVSLLGMLYLENFAIQKTRVFDDVSISLSRVKNSMLLLRRNEKDFLARLDLKYLDQFDANYDVLMERLEHLEMAADQAEIGTSLIEDMKAFFDGYHKSFQAIVEVHKKIGLDPKDGLYGRLRQAVHNAEEKVRALGNQLLLADMLQLRRNEKDFMLRQDMKYKAKFEKNFALFFDHLAWSDIPDETKREIQVFMDNYRTSFNELVVNYANRGLSSKEGLLGSMRAKVHQSEGILKTLSDELNRTIELEVGNLDKYMHTVTTAGILLAIMVLFVMGWLAYQIIFPIQALCNTMIKVADENNLSLRIKVRRDDEIGQTGKAFNDMLDKFQAIVSEVDEAASRIADASGEMSTVTLQTSQGIQEQRGQSSQLVLSISEMSDSIQKVAQDAVEAADYALQADQASSTGREVVGISSGTINTLSTCIQDAATLIHQVKEDSESIGTVLDVIRDIAEQTNLLALNAAIEAARAGEQGRGFAVVADEVRTLASRTQQSTEEIQGMIESLQNSTRQAVTSMDKSMNYTRSGVEQTSKVSDTLIGIANAVTHISSMNEQIAETATKQDTMAGEINTSVAVINQIVEQSAEGAEQTARSSAELSQLATNLKSLTGQFKVV